MLKVSHVTKYYDDFRAVNDISFEIKDVHIKSDETCVLEMHINKDYAESLGIETGQEVTIC